MSGDLAPALDLPCAYGGPPATGQLRQRPEDFAVEERLSFVPGGSGEHALLKIRKRGENTLWVARRLAELAGVPVRDVGYAGLKDRHALTTQWFSVGLGGRAEPDWQALAAPGIEVLDVVRHARKLRPGAVAENRFRLRLRGVSGDTAALAERLARLGAAGAPNYFGEQRFGRGGENLERAEALFAGRIRVRDRKLRGLYLSAARSFLFNAVLAERVSDGSWNRVLAGDVLGLDGRRAVFLAELSDETLDERIARQEIHPTGPLWGRGTPMPQGEPARLEAAVAARCDTLAEGLVAAGLTQERRALRTRLHDLQWSLDADTLELAFGLASGSFATAAIREAVDYRIAVPE